MPTELIALTSISLGSSAAGRAQLKQDGARQNRGGAHNVLNQSNDRSDAYFGADIASH